MKNLLFCTDVAPDFLGHFSLAVAPNLLYYSYIPIFFISILFSAFFYIRTKSKEGLLISLISFCLCLWITADIISWTTVDSAYSMLAWQLAVIPDFIIYLAVLYLIFDYNFKRDLHISVKIIGVVIFSIFCLLIPTNLNYYDFDLSYCEPAVGFISSNFLPLVRIITLALIFSMALIAVWKERANKLRVAQLALFNIGAIFLIGFFGLSQTYGDFTNSYQINLTGPAGMLVFIMIMAFMIVRYKAFNVKLVGAQALVIVLWAMVGSLIFVAQSSTERIVAGATLVFTTFAGFFLVQSVKKEVQQREELELLTYALEKANTRLKELDKQKSEFVSIASHQLRSPLTAIRGYASMLAEGSFGKLPQKAQESAARIEESAKLMAMSVEDYLNVSRIESGNMKYNLSDFNLRDMTDKLCDDLRPEALKKNLILLFRSDLQSRGVVNADVGKTNQIVHNLINNSLKYTPKGSVSVFVRDDIKKKRIYIDITDTGIGMSKETIHTLFQKFSRADNANSVNVSGTGLGLYVALKMAEQMGGDIYCKSEGDGKGSTFTFELPLAI